MHIPHVSLLSPITGLGVVVALAVPVLPAVAGTTAAAKVTCGKTIRHSFTLHRNLRNCRGDGLVVGASRITINLNGHTLDGTSTRASAGVRVTGFTGVVVKGGAIREFGRGVWLVRATNGRILRNSIALSVDEGIFTNESSSRALIQGNRISGSGARSGATWADGIDARGDGVTISGNTANGNHDDGIDANGNGDRVVGNRVDANGQDGIDIDGTGTLIQGNTGTRNGDDGIGVGLHGSQVSITGNSANVNRDLGIQPKAGSFRDGGGNRAAGNGDSRQCVGVKCS
jgi:hypothetical protein